MLASLEHPTSSPAHLRLLPYADPATPTPACFRRRRLVALVLLAALVAVLLHGVRLVAVDPGGVTAPASGASAASAPVDGDVAVRIVLPGDTVWSIARSIQPAGDVRHLVDGLLAQVDGQGPLQVGQRLLVPVP